MTGNRILLASALTFGACTSGDSMGMVTEGITCSTALTITGGTFMAATPACPYLQTGSTQCECWPVGTWTFTVAVDTTNPTNDCPSPQLDPSYGFNVTTTTDAETGDLVPSYALIDPNNTYPDSLVKTSDNGTCQGEVDLYSPDGKTVWEFNPAAAAQPDVGASTTLSGVGQYRVYNSDQWVDM